MQDLLIREAVTEDIPILLQFEQGVISAERPFDATLKPHPAYYYDLPGMIADPDVHLLVVEWNGEPVGSGYARIKEAKPYLKHERYAYLGFMYVRPDLRGKGINSQLIAELKNWVLRKDLTEMRLEVYSKNANAIRAYEKFGFEKHMIEMRMPV